MYTNGERFTPESYGSKLIEDKREQIAQETAVEPTGDITEAALQRQKELAEKDPGFSILDGPEGRSKIVLGPDVTVETATENAEDALIKAADLFRSGHYANNEEIRDALIDSLAGK